MVLLGTTLTLVVFAAAGLVGAAASVVAFAVLEARAETVSPSRRARALLGLRLFPAVFAAFCALSLFLPAFVLLEPRDSEEEVGLALALLAAAALALILRGPVSAARSWSRTRRRVRRWTSEGEPLALPGAPAPAVLVDTEFPLVAVFGILRPQVLMDRSVRDACSESEMRAVLEHERAHLASGDNLKRLIFRGAPDAIAWTSFAERMERAWSDAIEESADRSTRRALALPLASALVKVARLAVGGAQRPEAASALYRSGAITRRVRWLLAADAPPEAADAPGLGAGLAVALVLLLAASALVAAPLGLAHRVHGVTEAFVLLLQ